MQSAAVCSALARSLALARRCRWVLAREIDGDGCSHEDACQHNTSSPPTASPFRRSSRTRLTTFSDPVDGTSIDVLASLTATAARPSYLESASCWATNPLISSKARLLRCCFNTAPGTQSPDRMLALPLVMCLRRRHSQRSGGSDVCAVRLVSSSLSACVGSVCRA